MKRHGWKRNAILGLLAAVLAGTAHGTADQDRLWSTRIRCEVQTAGSQSLPDLTWQQGSTPLLSLDQYRSGKATTVTNDVTAIVTFGPSATSTYYVTATNYSYTGNGYLVRIPTVGTNTTDVTAGWWYTAYFEVGGYRYWTGNGRLDIVETTSTADGLTWQAITTAAAVTNEAALRAAADTANATASTSTNDDTIAIAYGIVAAEASARSGADAAEAILRAAGDAANTAALAAYSNHVRQVYLRGVDLGGGEYGLYLGD